LQLKKHYLGKDRLQKQALTMPENIILNELRRLILLKVGIKIVSPSDCKSISIEIQKELNKAISETTIKRLFGFAEIKSQFSRYTVNTLKEFVSDQYLDDNFSSVSIFPDYSESLDAVIQKAKKITLNTIKHIRNRCSLPYEMTIGRRFAKYDFEYFYLSEQSFTSFVSPPGYGKSILLSHLINDLFIKEGAIHKNDVILFINAIDLFDSQYQSTSIEDRIKSNLNILPSTDLIAYFTENYQINNTKLTIVVDGFPELLVNNISKPRVFEKIINFISEIDDALSIKLVLSMRSTMWNRFYETIKTIAFIKKKWFKGSYFNIKENSNVPALTIDEIEEIFKKISPSENIAISEKLKMQLKYPFHIHWYYQLKEKYPDFNSNTNILFYEIIDQFIQDKIYQSNYATEKILYCKKIIQLTNFGRNISNVLKSDLIKDLYIFKNAYMELLADGILMEEKIYENGVHLEYVRFIQPHILEYFLFLELLDVYDHEMDENFFNNLNNEYYGIHVRFQLLQWSIRFSLSTNRFENIKYILDLNLTNYEKNYLIYFIAENLNYVIKKNPDIKNQTGSKCIHHIVIKHLIHFDFIDSSYKDAINALLLSVDEDNNAIIYHAILSILDCLSLDQDLMLARIEKLDTLIYNREQWYIDPGEVCKFIYLKTKGIALTNDSITIKIEEFKKNPTIILKSGKTLPDSITILSILLMLLTNLFYGNPKEAIKIINSVITIYPKLLISRKPFAIYLLNLLATAKAKTNPDEKTEQMERILTYAINNQNNVTLYAQSLFQSLKAVQYKNRKQYDMALKIAYECIEIYKRNNLIVNEIYAYNLIINIYQAMGNAEMANTTTYIKMNILEAKKIHTAPFHSISNN